MEDARPRKAREGEEAVPAAARKSPCPREARETPAQAACSVATSLAMAAATPFDCSALPYT